MVMDGKQLEAGRRRRLVLCMGPYCNLSGHAEPLYDCLVRRLGERAPAWASKGPVRWEIANCLSMCGAGPNMITYPGEECYNHVDLPTPERVITLLSEPASE